jgi:hypothetical protein
VFIIRHDIEKDFREIVLARMGETFSYELAFQDPDSLIPPEIFAAAKKLGRTKPWGTAHALLCAGPYLDAPFAVLNSDDFYGREAFAALGAYLSSPSVTDAAIVPFYLEKTLSPQGTVSRGLCEVKDGYLLSVDELLLIKKEGDLIYNTNPDGTKRELAPKAPVSMNFWGFPQTILPAFQKYFDDFITLSGKELKSECYLPKAADYFIKHNTIRIRALEADSEWFGVTYREDREIAVKRIEALSSAGVYPEKLWN